MQQGCTYNNNKMTFLNIKIIIVLAMVPRVVFFRYRPLTSEFFARAPFCCHENIKTRDTKRQTSFLVRVVNIFTQRCLTYLLFLSFWRNIRVLLTKVLNESVNFFLFRVMQKLPLDIKRWPATLPFSIAW